MCLLCSCCIVLLLLGWDTGKVSDRFHGMVRFKGWLRGRCRIYIVITHVITKKYCSCNNMLVFLKYKSNVKTYIGAYI